MAGTIDPESIQKLMQIVNCGLGARRPEESAAPESPAAPVEPENRASTEAGAGVTTASTTR